MFKIYLVIFLLCFNASIFAKSNKQRPYDVVVSLGNTCQVAHQLKLNGIRSAAYPFDWVMSPFLGLYFFIATEGKFFLMPEKLVFCDHQLDASGMTVQSFIKDLNYQIEFLHDFDLTPDFIKDYSSIKEKYDRRTERFFELLNSKKKILFVRRNISYQEAILLDKLLKKKYPKLNYTILALGNTEEMKLDWKLKRVKNFYLRELEPWSWEGDPWAWNEILSLFPIKTSLSHK